MTEPRGTDHMNLGNAIPARFVLVTHDASVAARAHRTVRMRDGLIENDELNGTGDRDG